MTIFDFRKHKSCLYLPRLAIHSICFTAIQAQTLQIREREDCLILLISAVITSDNTRLAVFAYIYSLIFCSKTALCLIHLINSTIFFSLRALPNRWKMHVTSLWVPMKKNCTLTFSIYFTTTGPIYCVSVA